MAINTYSIDQKWDERVLSDETRVAMCGSFETITKVIRADMTKLKDPTLLTRLQAATKDFKDLDIPGDEELIDKEATEKLYAESMRTLKKDFLSTNLVDLKYLEQKCEKMQKRHAYVFEKYNELRDLAEDGKTADLDGLFNICLLIGKSYAEVSNVALGQGVFNTHVVQAMIRKQIEINDTANAVFDDEVKDL